MVRLVEQQRLPTALPESLEQQLEPVRQAVERPPRWRRGELARAALQQLVRQAATLERRALWTLLAARSRPLEVPLVLRRRLRPMSSATRATRESAAPRVMLVSLDQRRLLCLAVRPLVLRCHRRA